MTQCSFFFSVLSFFFQNCSSYFSTTPPPPPLPANLTFIPVLGHLAMRLYQWGEVFKILLVCHCLIHRCFWGQILAVSCLVYANEPVIFRSLCWSLIISVVTLVHMSCLSVLENKQLFVTLPFSWWCQFELNGFFDFSPLVNKWINEKKNS